ncbi:hypothetical protein ACFWA4_29220 [Streptomyces sp. NPDC060011]|uniref:hypothetical protein n=1 Tax=Streptomyces sp. NPDC060011 TaxID=3347037 RepID=UPI0036AC4737
MLGQEPDVVLLGHGAELLRLGEGSWGSPSDSVGVPRFSKKRSKVPEGPEATPTMRLPLRSMR